MFHQCLKHAQLDFPDTGTAPAHRLANYRGPAHRAYQPAAGYRHAGKATGKYAGQGFWGGKRGGACRYSTWHVRWRICRGMDRPAHDYPAHRRYLPVYHALAADQSSPEEDVEAHVAPDAHR